MKNWMKEKLERGENASGTFFESGSEAIVEFLGLANLDYLVIDMEHAPYTIDQVTAFIRAAELREITPLVRIKNTLRSTVLNVLDIGARGLIIPAVKTVEEVKQVLEYSKYYPTGQRGAFFPRAYNYGLCGELQNITAHFEETNNTTMILPQCETKEILDVIEDVVALEGVDGIFIGPYDLSIALGKPAAFDDPMVSGAFKRVLKACVEKGKYCFIYAPTAAAAKSYFQQGYRGACISSDIIEIGNAYKGIVGTLSEG